MGQNQTWSDVLVTPPTDLVVTVGAAKEHLRLPHLDDDAYLQTLIKVAVNEVENYTSYSLGAQVRLYTCDQFPEYFEIPRRPITVIDWIKYYNTDGVLTTLSASYYQTDLKTRPTRIKLAADQASWPVTEQLKMGQVQVQYQSGASTIPENFKMAVLLLVAEMYWKRTPEVNIAGVTAAERLVIGDKLWM